jgi:hypothetical protein
MQKTPISIALERQIPEFVREEYDLFVYFIKAYYKFLEETQQRNLEDIRSIETTLDQFIANFKKELSIIFPTDSLADERFIIQRIREFYKTRGSVESFKFLFRVLFNRDAEITYPSRQILRASDGKWVQEKSVFVKQEQGSLLTLSDKIITIQTAKKHISIYSPRVIFYRDDIYEVFIDRSYVEDISIDDIVTYTQNNVTHSGKIVPCPVKYTISNRGSGFQVGEIYNLTSNEGPGSLVKITKIGTGGEIRNIQVIKFELDYKSTFYAKLTNKKKSAFPYYSPVTTYINDGVTEYSGRPAYAEGTSGTIEYGYINTQNYFFYDANYDAPNDGDSVIDTNPLYADSTYVGDVIGSFYTNDSVDNAIDETAAEIKIELGAVAIYPGFYSTNDSFISDEIYIQDGKYYQLFSYVIKVEQQVETYRDIIKSLVHPSGMNMFVEFNIKRNYIVSAIPPLTGRRLQFNDVYLQSDSIVNTFETIMLDNFESVDEFILILNEAAGRITTDTINTEDVGTLYYNAYNENTENDVLTVWSYEAEVYSQHTSTSLT